MDGVQASVAFDFLDKLPDERSLDRPLLALLHLLGFKDIALTHGANELGRDVIAKKQGEQGMEQWCFQAKRGAIRQSEMQQVEWQLRMAATATYPHPLFEASLPRVLVLVCSGELIGTAQALFDGVRVRHQKEGIRVELWNRQVLAARFAESQALASWSDWSSIGHTIHVMRYESRGLEAIRDVCNQWINRETAADRIEVWRCVLRLSLLAAFMDSECCILQASRILYGLVALVSGAVELGGMDMRAGTEIVDQIGATLVDRAKSRVDRADIPKARGGSGWHRASVYPLGVQLQLCGEDIGVALAVLATSQERLIEEGGGLRLALMGIVEDPIGMRPPGENYAVSCVAIATGLTLVGETISAYVRSVAAWVAMSYRERLGLAPIGSSPEKEAVTLGTWRLEMQRDTGAKTTTIGPAILDVCAVIESGADYEACQHELVGAVTLGPQKIVPSGCAGESVATVESSMLVTAGDYPPRWLPMDSWRVAAHHRSLGGVRWFDTSGRSWVGLALGSWWRDRWWLHSLRQLVAARAAARER